MNPNDKPLADRRRSVATEEASALREEVVRWVRDGEAGETAAEIIRDLVRDGLAEQVEMALNSRDLGGQLGDELRANLSGRFADDLRQAVVAEVQRALAEGVLGDAELKKLREEMRAEVREALAGRSARRPAGSSGGGFAPQGRDPRLWLGAAAAVFVLALGLLAGVWWMARAPQGDTAGGGTDPVAQGGGAAPDATESPADSTAADGSGADSGTDPLFAAWSGLAPSPPAGLAVEREDFACWFPASTRTSLDALVADARGSGTSVENRLADAFGSCVASYAPAGGGNETVFAAQAAARRALTRHAGNGWNGCRTRPSRAPNTARFTVDGLSGPGTHSLLTAYLTCRGVDAAVSFDNGSSAADYLFAVYLALTDPVLG
ncbi:MAG TPA: hypothetical protein VKU40_01610 [Thermoanaerobaculia bacterium]|nr:hypothetical protein [Thermoanaerobaculia bacterium]